MNWLDLIKEHRLALNASELLSPQIKKIASVIQEVQDKHGKVILCGNGGSFAHAQHLAAELVVRYRQTREPMRAVVLGCNGAIATAICNDLKADDLFVREFGGILDPEDCVVAFSTSGKSKNVLTVLNLAHQLGLPTIGITGANGMACVVDHEFRAPSEKTAIIQQIHTLAIHGICEILEAS